MCLWACTWPCAPITASVIPWVEPAPDGVMAAAGPDAFRLSTALPLRIEQGKVVAEFVAIEGPASDSCSAGIPRTWRRPLWRTPTRRWLAQRRGGASGQAAAPTRGEYRDEVLTSLIVLKAMTNEATGALVAAPTTSLPEDIGGVRNWDYRYCWLRDSVLTLDALLAGGYTEEALAFRDYLSRVGTGDPRSCRSCTGSAASGA